MRGGFQAGEILNGQVSAAGNDQLLPAECRQSATYSFGGQLENLTDLLP